MHVFRMEMRLRRVELALWSVGMVALVEGSFVKYQALATGGGDLDGLMAQLPPMVQAVFGMTGLEVGTVAGFYGVMFLYVALMAAVHAGLVGEGLFAREVQGRTAEFLYAKPVGRSRVATEKLLAGVANVVVLNIVTTGVSFAAVSSYASVGDMAREISVLMFALLVIQLVFLSLGALLSMALEDPRAAGAAISALVLASYLGYVLHKLVPSVTCLRALSVFSYFDAAELVPDMNLGAGYVAACVACVVGCLAATYVLHSRRDFGA